MNVEEAKMVNCYVKAILITIGLCAIALGLIYLAQYFYNPSYGIASLWPVFPIIAGIVVTITALCTRVCGRNKSE
ncbi:MAG: hypothetical protein GY756_15135 [bacterium]|nr:hypothetical protein [bacterium]